MNRNNLMHENSLYLLQHKDNPVHWQPWNEQTLEQAKKENKPVFLSIGYASCHWCHVMAHETFEDPAIAQLLNEHFISIKVDREERPDIDAIYQKALTLLRQSGGWPLNIFLLPDGSPFFGGTYFPPTQKHERPSFRMVLESIISNFQSQYEKISYNAAFLKESLQTELSGSARNIKNSLTTELLDNAAHQLAGHIDPAHGGLKGAPKFPMPSMLEFLWRAWQRTHSEALRDSVLITLEHICQGGIYDHLGGGFSRYSTDEQWLVPHFEKMLYDNAQLISLLASAWQETHFPLLKLRTTETVLWCLRDLLSSESVFMSSLDADTEMGEGEFYVWSDDEITECLVSNSIPTNDIILFKTIYDVSQDGNFDHMVILNRNHRLPVITAEDETRLARMRDILFQHRNKRLSPQVDSKILTDWNGMMVFALAKAGKIFSRPEWITQAEKTFFAIISLMTTQKGHLSHSWSNGKQQNFATLEDYASMIQAGIMLYQVTGNIEVLSHAQSWCDLVQEFYSDEAGGWFMTSSNCHDTISRPKTVLDHTTPSGNALMISSCFSLHWMTGQSKYYDWAKQAITALSDAAIQQFPSSCGLFNSFDYLEDTLQIIIAGSLDSDDFNALWDSSFKIPLSNVVISPISDASSLFQEHPAYGKMPSDGRSAAYLCRGQTCFATVFTPEQLEEAINTFYFSAEN